MGYVGQRLRPLTRTIPCGRSRRVTFYSQPFLHIPKEVLFRHDNIQNISSNLFVGKPLLVRFFDIVRRARLATMERSYAGRSIAEGIHREIDS